MSKSEPFKMTNLVKNTVYEDNHTISSQRIGSALPDYSLTTRLMTSHPQHPNNRMRSGDKVHITQQSPMIWCP